MRQFQKTSFTNQTTGFILIILTYFIFSIMELIAKDLGQRYDSFFIVFVRYISQLIFLIILFNKNFLKFTKSELPKLQLGRGALLMMTTCFMFAGLAALPFAEHIAVYMIGPVLTTLMAIIFFEEIFKIYHFFGASFIILGIMIANISFKKYLKLFN